MIVMTPQEATQKASEIVAKYPNATNVQDALELAFQDGFYFHDYNPEWSEESVAKAMIHAHKTYLSQKVGA